MPSVFVISLLKIKPYLVTENIYSVGGICHQRHIFTWARPVLYIAGCFCGFWCPGSTRRLNMEIVFGDTFAACSKLSSSFVNVKVSGKMSSSRLLRYGANIGWIVWETTYAERFIAGSNLRQRFFIK